MLVSNSGQINRLDTPIASLPYNGVFRFCVANRAEKQIDDIISHYKKRGVEHLWLVHPTSQPANLDELLSARGLVEAEVFTGMVVEPKNLKADASTPENVDIHEISASEEDVILELVANRWSVPTDAMPHLQSFFRENNLGRKGSPMRGWLATTNGRPVGKGFTLRTDNIVGLYGVATQPEARSKGIGKTLCARALLDSCDSDVDLLVLHSTPIAHRLYKNFGFRDVAPFKLLASSGDFSWRRSIPDFIIEI